MGLAPGIGGAGVAATRFASTFDGDTAFPHLAHDPAVEERKRRIHHVGVDVTKHASATGHIERETVGIPRRLADLGGGRVKHVFAAEIAEEGADCGREVV